MKEDNNLKYFKGVNHLGNIQDQHNFYEYIKKLFCSTQDSKWKTMRYKRFVKQYELSYSECHSILSSFFENSYKFRYKNKLFKKFLLQIEKYNEVEDDFKIILKENNRNDAIAEYIKYLENYTDFSKSKIFTITHRNIKTNITLSTLRSYYYEYKLSSK